jgi:ribosomal protein S18 acetylase RimI-like enzyme
MKVGMEAMMVRPYDERDLERVGLIHSRSRQAAYTGLVPDEALARVTPEQQVEVWRERMARLPSPSAPLVAEVGGDVIGFALAQMTPETGAELVAIHVLPEHQGTGAGKALMVAVVAAFRDWGAAAATLHVIAGNERAQAFYRRSGWHLRGPAGYHDLGEAEVPVLEYGLVVGGPPFG